MKNAAREERKADEEKSHFHRYAGIWKKYDRCCDSKASGISVYDTDLMIQEQEGKLLREIIEERGTDGFLEIENQVNASVQAEKR